MPQRPFCPEPSSKSKASRSECNSASMATISLSTSTTALTISPKVSLAIAFKSPNVTTFFNIFILPHFQVFIIGGAFVGLDQIIAKRLGKGVIGFETMEKHRLDTNEMNYLFSKVEVEDIISFGIIPEFVGRFNSIANFNELTHDDLIHILTEPKHAIISQYTSLFAEDGVELSFTEGALRAIAAKAKDAGTGARALRMIVENLLVDLMYEVPSDPSIRAVIIEQETVENGQPPTVKRSESA